MYLSNRRGVRVRGETDTSLLTEGYDDMTGNQRFDETWLTMFRKKDGIRCPFWRRRAADLLETALGLGRFFLARHKRLDVNPLVISTGSKTTGLDLVEIKDHIQNDFQKGKYYVSGKLTKSIYADDCYFDSPDPDMPVRGLRKYVDAISHLFDQKQSDIQLLDIRILDDKRVLARWRLEGTLMLPWRPKFKAYTGCTVYEVDSRGLIVRHIEKWSISALDAFISTVAPDWPLAAEPALSAEKLKELPNFGAPSHESILLM